MIIFIHHTGEPHGILGAQVAATFFQRKLSVPTIVVGIERNFSKESLFHFIDQYYEGREKVVAFSHLCGRKDLIQLIQELKKKGFMTILGGPQAILDYEGEPEAEDYQNRFKGLKSVIDLCYQGPVDGFQLDHLNQAKKVVNQSWDKEIFLEVDWSNLYIFSNVLKKLDVQLGQVLNSIGCAYAHKKQTLFLPSPTILQGQNLPELEVQCNGCIFCDVSKDKGYHGSLGLDKVITQILGLPEKEGRKIPFELIDEYPIRFLGTLLEKVKKERIQLLQINLVCRVDDINLHASELSDILSLAQTLGIRIMFASIGFESFNDQLLHYLCKGICLDGIIECVHLLRRLKGQFGNHLLFRRDEGANHGFIRPTPWDNDEILRDMDRDIFLHQFYEDILPEYSTPLIIHHASYLGDWIRKIESMREVTFNREGTWIEWWNPFTS